MSQPLEPMRPVDPEESIEPRLTILRFMGINAAWGALIGLVITISWHVVMQDFWFINVTSVLGAALSAMYGLLCSIPAFLVVEQRPRFEPMVVGCVFGVSALVLQLLLIGVTRSAGELVWNAAAYSVIGGVVAAVVFRRGRHDEPDQNERDQEATA